MIRLPRLVHALLGIIASLGSGLAQPVSVLRPAKAKAQVVNGFLVNLEVADQGDGYDEPPAILLRGAGGMGAIVQASVLDGRVVAIDVKSPGTGYPIGTTVEIEPPPPLAKYALGDRGVELVWSGRSVTAAYLRRRAHQDFGITYLLESSPDLIQWTPVTLPEVAATLDAEWERVTVDLGEAPENGDVYLRVHVAEVFVPEGFVSIRAGGFQMGDSMNDRYLEDARPVHPVWVSRFAIQATEVTFAQLVEALNWAAARGKVSVRDGWARSAGEGEHRLTEVGGIVVWNAAASEFSLREPQQYARRPCEVSWHGAAAYCNYRSEMEGLVPCYSLSDLNCDFAASGYRLPTEAEWEKAARGGFAGRRYPWGNTASHQEANMPTSIGMHPRWMGTSPVGSFPANGFGLYDVIGNLNEWCNDWMAPGGYSSSSVIDPVGAPPGLWPEGLRVKAARGGKFDVLRGLPVAERGGYNIDFIYADGTGVWIATLRPVRR